MLLTLHTPDPGALSLSNTSEVPLVLIRHEVVASLNPTKELPVFRFCIVSPSEDTEFL